MDAWESTPSPVCDQALTRSASSLCCGCGGVRMVHAARAHATWMSVVIVVSVTASYLTWLFASKETEPRGRVINGTSMADMFRIPPSKAQWLLKVKKSSAEKRVAWVEEWSAEKFFLDESKMWITVKEQGIYLVYIQVTYGLREDGNSSTVDLGFSVFFSYTEGYEDFAGAYDTRQLTEKEQDAHLTALLLLKMKAGNQLSVLALSKERIKYNDVHPFSTFITIVRYADWSG